MSLQPFEWSTYVILDLPIALKRHDLITLINLSHVLPTHGEYKDIFTCLIEQFPNLLSNTFLSTWCFNKLPNVALNDLAFSLYRCEDVP